MLVKIQEKVRQFIRIDKMTEKLVQFEIMNRKVDIIEKMSGESLRLKFS